MDNHEGHEPNHEVTPQVAHGNIQPHPPAAAPDDGATGSAERPGSWFARNGPYLMVILALILLARFYWGLDLLTLFTVAVGLGFLIFIHELGHFLVAKWCNVHVTAFSIGFGPALPGCSFKRGETTYMIALFPLGGYVKMVGEGPESEEQEDDPRSFKNKPVWQRMAIISAGVTMNIILGFALFVFVYMTHGEERAPGVIDRIEPGSPAWQKGVHTGDVIYQIDGVTNPYFDDLMTVVMKSSKGEALPFIYGPPNAPPQQRADTTIVPRREKGALRPIIGIGPPAQLVFWPARMAKERQLPVLYQSAAARAQPGFEFGDAIIATTDPNHGGQVTLLPPDPRNPKELDYFEFRRRSELLAGKEMIIRVRRADSHAEVDVKVPPAYAYTVGVRMRLGKVVAIRDNSPATGLVQEDDIIEQVSVTDGDGHITRYVTSKPAATTGNVREKPLDPLRLPFELRQWAKHLPAGADKTVTLTLLRTNPPPEPGSSGNHEERQKVTPKLQWQEGWEFDNEQPGFRSPVAIPGLGIAYGVETTVEDVEPGSPADKAGVQKGDVIKQCRFFTAGKKLADKPEPGDWEELEANKGAVQGAVIFQQLQFMDIKQMSWRLERENKEITLTAEPDQTWPTLERGLLLQADKRLQKAHTFGQALRMGTDRTLSFIEQIFANLQSIITGRVSFKLFGGPIMIAQTAFSIAGENFYQFLVLLAIISVNLAVINFLPIPVLDGGHMVFLLYEKIVGKPAPEKVLSAALIVGIILLAGLMIVVTYLDLGGRRH